MKTMERHSKKPSGWIRPPTSERGRASGQREAYSPTDPRVELNSCDHTQIMDNVFPVTVWCLDCGQSIHIADDLVDISSRVLSDTELLELREAFNTMWWGAI